MDIPSLLEDFQYHGSLKDDIGQTWILRVPSKLPSPEDIVILQESLDNVYASLRALTDKDVDVFMMRYFDNCKISEISKDFNLTRSKVETSLTNTKKSVRQNLQSRGKLY